MSLTFSNFDPTVIQWQDKAIDEIECQYDYGLGVHETLLSGAVGSAKTTLLAHMIIKHCLMYPGAHVMIGRKSLKDLKGTLYAAILSQLDQPDLNKRFHQIDTTAIIKFTNGSIIRGVSWADKKYKKVRSYEFSMAVIEELTENNSDDYEIYREIVMRIRSRVPQKLVLCATNPDSPSHWAFKHFISSENPLRHVYYSVSSDNPFLPPNYVEKLRAELSPKEARRMLYGEWIELASDIIYYEYNGDLHFKKGQTYEINPHLPIAICFDFNIGLGKPMSCAIGQFDFVHDHFHCFDEIVIQGARTDSMLEEIAMRGILDNKIKIQVYGDATGESQSTKSIHSDYDLIRKFLSNYKRPDGSSLQFEMKVPRSNPPIRERHNRLNAYFKNDLGQVRFSVYQKCKVTDEGFRLTALKKGADYIEDDSKSFQHITTAIGYWVVYESRLRGAQQVRTTAR